MSELANKIQAEALDLSVRERARLAHRLLESLDEEIVEDPVQVTAAWKEETARRVEEHWTGQAPAISAKEVFAEARRRSKRR